MYCPKCNSLRTGHYCYICGEKLSDKLKCKNCLRDLNPVDNYCENCGKITEKGIKEKKNA